MHTNECTSEILFGVFLLIVYEKKGGGDLEAKLGFEFG